MKFIDKEIENEAVLDIAKMMCISARTSPKTKGQDNIATLILTGEDINNLADQMEILDKKINGDTKTSITRDAGNLRKSAALVLVGAKKEYYGLECGYCGFESCSECIKNGKQCVFSSINLGIAVDAAAKTASNLDTDCRIMYTAGRAYGEYNPDENMIWLGIPLSATGKSIYFDRPAVAKNPAKSK